MRARLVAPAALAALAARPADACAPAPHAGEAVRIAAEEALIVWDPARRVEHFVRAATFDTAAKDFGFLVPTPTAPTLAAEDASLFPLLARRSRPEVIIRRSLALSPTLGCAAFMLLSRGASERALTSAAPAPVRVLSAQQVAGYDAVVLEADDPAALARWLDEHRYATTPALTAWLAPYVARRWKITAFKIAAPDPNDPQPPRTSPVRMTFSTDVPFYPYREPEDQRAPGGGPRTLQVHVVSAERMEGALGERGAWPGRVTYSGPTDDLGDRAARWGLSAGLTRLTTFEDASSPRPGTDEVFFRRATDQAGFTPPPVYLDEPRNIWIPLDWIAIAGVAGAFGWRRWRRPRAA
ncbi:MAG: DUF2330 domain-containing protein [Polyangiales bacterium]